MQVPDAMVEQLRQAGELLSSYVTHGALRHDTEFDDTFADLSPLIPDTCRRTPPDAYRVIVLSSTQYNDLVGGRPLQQRQRTYGSWTADERSARLLLRIRYLNAPHDAVAVIVRKALPAGSCVVDVEALYRELGWHGGDVEDWANYVSWEREIVVRQDASLLSIEAADLVAAYRADAPEAMRPLEGERVWLPSIEDFVVIETVPESQPDSASGTWNVEYGGTPHTMQWDRRNDCWEATDDRLPLPARSG